MFFAPKPPKVNDPQTGSVSLNQKETVQAPVVPPVAKPQSQPVQQPVAPVKPAPGTEAYVRPAAAVKPAEQQPDQVQAAHVQQNPAIKLSQANSTTRANAEMASTLKNMAAPGAGMISPNIIRVPSMNSIFFADLWLTPENIMFIRDERTKFALVPLETEDMVDFQKALEQNYTGSSSYALKFAGESYRVERILTVSGIQYNCRKMPKSTPDIFDLGLPEPIVKHLVGLSQESGLLLLCGPTGMGKTTTCSALIKKYLENDGGFLYTIEDPPEMPLDGLYQAKNGALGLCKQTPVENERWGDGLKSALRSRPRYILVGEIRTPETASQTLRAATSGHLVISTIHANSVEDGLNSIIKYATAAGLQEELAADLLGRGILGVVHQKLEGIRVLRPEIRCAFANPNPTVADQMRMTVRDGKINLSTLIEAQMTKLYQGKPLFKDPE